MYMVKGACLGPFFGISYTKKGLIADLKRRDLWPLNGDKIVRVSVTVHAPAVRS